MGITLLFSKQPIAAFECLYQTIDVYSQNARLWLRLAECCLMCFKHSLADNYNEQQAETSSAFVDYIAQNATSSGNEKITKLSEKIKCVSKSFGSGFHHKIEIGTSLEPKAATRQDESQAISLEFAYMCLKNALNLLPCNKQIFATAASQHQRRAQRSKFNANSSELADDDECGGGSSGLDDSGDTSTSASMLNEDEKPKSQQQQQQQTQQQLDKKLFNCVWPSKPINIIELQSLRASILTAIAYVALCLKDFIGCIKYCNTILDKEDLINTRYPISKGHRLDG